MQISSQCDAARQKTADAKVIKLRLTLPWQNNHRYSGTDLCQHEPISPCSLIGLLNATHDSEAQEEADVRRFRVCLDTTPCQDIHR